MLILAVNPVTWATPVSRPLDTYQEARTKKTLGSLIEMFGSRTRLGKGRRAKGVVEGAGGSDKVAFECTSEKVAGGENQFTHVPMFRT